MVTAGWLTHQNKCSPRETPRKILPNTHYFSVACVAEHWITTKQATLIYVGTADEYAGFHWYCTDCLVLGFAKGRGGVFHGTMHI